MTTILYRLTSYKKILSRVFLFLSFFIVGLLIAVFYTYILDLFFLICFLASITVIGLSIIMTRLKLFGIKSNEMRFLYSYSIGITLFAFLATMPLNVDRSFSVLMLSKIENRALEGNSFTTKSLSVEMASFFNPESEEITRRLNEQIELGNVEILRDDKIRLTSKGEFTIKVLRFISHLFNLNPKYVGH